MFCVFLLYYTPLVTYHLLFVFFFFNDTATTEIYTLSLHDALPISRPGKTSSRWRENSVSMDITSSKRPCLGHCFTIMTLPSFSTIVALISPTFSLRSEEHTSELQSRLHLVCRLLLEKKKKTLSQVT